MPGLPLRPSLPVLTAAEARSRLLAGTPGPFRFRGRVDLSGELALTRLPEGLCGDTLDVSGTGLAQLPEHLELGELVARFLPLETVPASLSVRFRLTLDGSPRLTVLPAGLSVGSLSVQDCPSLERLPEELDVCFLNVSGCEALAHWPRQGRVEHGALLARNCLSLRALPSWLTRLSSLDVSGCRGLGQLPPGLRVSGALDVAGSGLGAQAADQAGLLRWRGVRVDRRVAFEPERLSGAEVLTEPNAEVRRVMLERVGSERFLREVSAQVLDRDHDAGGERVLLRAELPGDEPFVAVSVQCPSTAQRYVLRVPPTTRTARAASAWLAGFDDPDAYRPVAEA